ncbi:MAG TPA: hypothetical protein VFP84_01440, partial [Kofleriaceae bacterium]|nr:hypothetical protein [Kofleriaceae bacterium]
MDDALDDVIARAHQVDSESAAAWEAERAAQAGELDALRTQVAVLEKKLAEAQPVEVVVVEVRDEIRDEIREDVRDAPRPPPP